MSSPNHPDPRELEPPDAGEPQGAYDPDRPAMLGPRFRMTLATGMLIGLVVALVAHGLLVYTWYTANTWSWFFVAVGGMAVGGALTLFLYGAATDRTDTGPKEHGRADVQERGEWRRTLDRRRARRGSPRPR
jgi:hypothetical protein